jgi:uridylate kinase
LGNKSFFIGGNKMKFKRILLKLSGESLAGTKGTGIDFDRVLDVCKEIKEVAELGIEVAIVVGGGNFWRGRSNQQMDRCTSDYIGMLGTTMNALAIGDAFKQLGQEVRVQTGVEMRQIAEFFIKDRALKHLTNKRVLVFGCGTGSPFFSTDTAAALRAAEINADALLKATNVDGIYDKDPKKHKDAIKINEITYLDVLNKKLNVMDTTATTLCMDNEIPIVVFDINEHGNLKKVLLGETIGTIVQNKIEE